LGGSLKAEGFGDGFPWLNTYFAGIPFSYPFRRRENCYCSDGRWPHPPMPLGGIGGPGLFTSSSSSGFSISGGCIPGPCLSKPLLRKPRPQPPIMPLPWKP
jgi:hypothetical protein